MTFLEELKRRHVYRVAAAYVVVGWLLIQVATQVFPVFHLPDWIDQAVVLLILIGFPIALVLAWAFDATQGIVRTDAEDDASQVSQRSHRTGAAVGLLGVLIAVIAGAVWWHTQRREPAVAHNPRAMSTQSASVTSSTRLVTKVSAAASSMAATPIPGKSVAVLPLVNESGDKDQQYFSDGLSEDLITALSQFAGLKVINRDSSFQFRDSKDSVQVIGEQLGVAHLLEGSVRKLGDEVRISAELVNCADGSTLWSEHYDRPYKDLFALQDGITKAVADALKAKLLTTPGAVAQSDRPPSGNLAAYTAYLRGVADEGLETKAGQRNAIAQFDEAIRLDPRYALAYAATSDAWQALAATFDLDAAEQRLAIAQARAAVDRALQLNPDLAAAHGALAGLMISFDFNWQGALSESQRAAELAPGSPDAKSGLAATQARLGHLTTAVELDRQALASAPLSAGGYFGLGRKLSGLGQLDEAETALRKSIELAPGASRPHAYLAIIEVQRGDAAAALAAAQKTPSGFWHDFAVALASQIGTNRMAAEAALKNFTEKDSGTAAYQIAEVYALRRDPDNLFKWLDRAWSNDDAGVELLLFDPLMLRYKDDPRFTAFCKKVGLPTTTDAKALQ